MAVIVNGELVEVVALPDQTGHAGQALVTDGVNADWAALAGTGDMTKATYDTNNNGIVDQAAAVNDGIGNSKTAVQIRTHIDSTSNPHNVTAAQIGVPTTPSGTGLVHVTAGVQDGASKLVANADVDAGAAIAETKLSLNYPTHSNTNDPSADQKNALVGTNGTPYSGNRYVTDSDPRNTNTRTPVAHGSAQHTGTIGTPTQVGLGNVPNVDTTNAANIISGTLPAARLPAMSAGAKGGVPATGAPSGKYLKDDGTWDSPAGAGDMAKATYDTTNNSIVDKAETVDDGAGNSATAAAIKTALTATIPGKADLVAGAVNGHLAGLDGSGNLTDSGNEPADFAPAAKGVTDGDSHDHTGGAGAAITEDALSLSNVTTGDVDNTKHGFCPITPNDTDKFLRGDATWAVPPSGGSPPSGTGWRHVTAGVEDAASSTPTKTDVGLGNVANLDQTNPVNITQDATHRFATDAEKSAWNAKLDPSGSGANLTGIPEGALSFTNITTNDVSTTKHGLTPRAPNDTTKYLRGDATWAIPSVATAGWGAITTKPWISPGDTGYATLDAILAGSPAAGTSILVPSGTHTLHASNDRTVPIGVTLKALSGANIVIPSGRTLTIAGHFEAGDYKTFTDNSGDLTKGVKFTGTTSMTHVKAVWWGLAACAFDDTSAATINSNAINYALNASPSNATELLRSRIPVLLGDGYFYLNAAPGLTQNCTLKGSAAGPGSVSGNHGVGTALFPVNGSTDYLLKSTDVGGWIVKDIAFFSINNNKDAIYITNAVAEMPWRVTNCSFNMSAGTRYGVYGGSGSGRGEVDHCRCTGNLFFDNGDGTVHDNEIQAATIGIYLYSSDCYNNGIYGGYTGIYATGTALIANNKCAQNSLVGIDCKFGSRSILNGNQLGGNGVGLRVGGNCEITGSGNIIAGNYIGVELSGNDSYSNATVNNSISGILINNNMGSNWVNFYVPYYYPYTCNRGLPVIENNIGCDLPGFASSNTVMGRYAPSNGLGVLDSTGDVYIAPSEAINLYDLSLTATLTQPGGSATPLIVVRTGDWATDGVRLGDLVHFLDGNEAHTQVLTVTNIYQSSPPGGAYNTLSFVNSADFSSLLGTGTVELKRLPDIYRGSQINMSAASPITVTEVYGYGNGNVRNLISYPGDNITYGKWGAAPFSWKYVAAAGGTVTALTGTDTLFAVVGDGVLLESYQPFSGIQFTLSTALAGTGVTLGAKYWNNSTWVQLPGVVTTNFLNSTGVAEIYWNPPEDWCTGDEAVPNATNDVAGQHYKIMVTLTAGTGITAAITSAMTNVSWLRLSTATWPASPLAGGVIGNLQLKCIKGVWAEISRSTD